MRLSLLVLSLPVLVIGCGDSGDPDGGMFEESVRTACQRVYDSTYDACYDGLSSTCVGIGCLFIVGECQTRALREAGICCVNTTSTQQQYDACVDSLPTASPPVE